MRRWVSEPPGTYEVLADGGRVEAWSTVRLPFEPTGVLRDLRGDLRSAMRQLEPRAGGALRATYSAAAAARDADAENVLLYNVGSASYGHLARDEIVVERHYAVPPSPDNLTLTAPLHHHRYEVVYAGEAFIGWLPGRLLATFDALRFPAGEKVGPIWAAVRTQPNAVTLQASASARPFLLELELSRPMGRRSSLPNLVKPLVDGLVSALHVHDAPLDAELARRLVVDSGGFHAAPSSILESGWAALGPRRVIHARGDTVQWNPADDQCVGLRVRLSPRPAAGPEWTVTGTLCDATTVP